MSDSPEKKAPGCGGSRGKDHQRHHIPWGDDWSRRHPTARWSGLEKLNDPPAPRPLRPFGSTSMSQQAAAALSAKLKGRLPSNLREQAALLMAQGRFVEASAILRFLEEQAQRFNERGGRR